MNLEFKFKSGTEVMKSVAIENAIHGLTSINYQVMAEMMRADVLDHFRQEQGSNGKIWERWHLNGKTVSTRPTKRGGTKLLQDTGRLRGSINPQYTDNSAIVGIGSGLNYAATHNYGTSKIPQREFAWLSVKAIERIINYIINKITGKEK